MSEIRPMFVLGVEITPQQIAAGNAAMVARFRAHDVVRALVGAGVVASGYVANRTADRLMQKARKEGLVRVSRGNKRIWRATPDAQMETS